MTIWFSGSTGSAADVRGALAGVSGRIAALDHVVVRRLEGEPVAGAVHRGLVIAEGVAHTPAVEADAKQWAVVDGADPLGRFAVAAALYARGRSTDPGGRA